MCVLVRAYYFRMIVSLLQRKRTSVIKTVRFQTEMSYVHAIISVTENKGNENDEKSRFFNDQKDALYTPDQSILLDRNENYGLRGDVLQILSNHPHGKRQKKIN